MDLRAITLQDLADAYLPPTIIDDQDGSYVDQIERYLIGHDLMILLSHLRLREIKVKVRIAEREAASC